MKENEERDELDIAKEHETINAISDFFNTITYLDNVKKNMEGNQKRNGEYPHQETIKKQVEDGLSGIKKILSDNKDQNNDLNIGKISLNDLKTSVNNGDFFKYEKQQKFDENKKQISSNDISQIRNKCGKQLICNLKYDKLSGELGALNSKIAGLRSDLKGNNNIDIDASEKQKQISELTKLTNIKKNFVNAMNTWLSNDESLKAINENKQKLQANIKFLKENTKFQKVYDDLNQTDKKGNEDEKNKEVKKLSEIRDDELIKFLNEKSENIGKNISSKNSVTEAQVSRFINNIKTLGNEIQESEKNLSDDFKKINDMIQTNLKDISTTTTNNYLAEDFMKNNEFNQSGFNNEFLKDVLLGDTSHENAINNQVMFRNMIKESLIEMDNKNGVVTSVDINGIGAIFLNAFDENENQDELDKIFKNQIQTGQVINNLYGLSQDPDYKEFIQKILSNKGLSRLLQGTANKLVNKFKDKQYEELPWYKKIVSPLKFMGYQWRNHKATTILKTLGVVGIGGGISAAAFLAPAILMASIELAIAIVAIYAIVKLMRFIVDKVKNRGKDPEQSQENEKDSTYYANKLYTMATAFGLNHDNLKELAEKTTKKSELSKDEKKALNSSLKSIENMYKTYDKGIVEPLLTSQKIKTDGITSQKNDKNKTLTIGLKSGKNQVNRIIPKKYILPLKIAKNLGYKSDKTGSEKGNIRNDNISKD